MTESISPLAPATTPENEASSLLLAHLSRKPHAVLIVSMSEGNAFLSHCMGFTDPGQALVARELVHNMTTEFFARQLAASRQAKQTASTSNPPEDSL